MDDNALEGAHLNEPHSGDLGGRLNWLRAGVLGANDGIVSVAALVVGVAGATTDFAPLLTAGIAAATLVWMLWRLLRLRITARMALKNATGNI